MRRNPQKVSSIIFPSHFPSLLSILLIQKLPNSVYLLSSLFSSSLISKMIGNVNVKTFVFIDDGNFLPFYFYQKTRKKIFFISA